MNVTNAEKSVLLLQLLWGVCYHVTSAGALRRGEEGTENAQYVMHLVLKNYCS